MPRCAFTHGLGRMGFRLALGALGLCALFASHPVAKPVPEVPPPPQLLSQTGLYADITTKTIAADHLPFTPQYPLWSDGAAKRRWIHLPAGTAIDASDAERWVFPVGTQFYKEFTFGKRIETRLMQRNADGTWTFATYGWDDDGGEARLVPEKGRRAWTEIQPGVRWDIPGRYDCLACHASADHPVLGFNALQLSPDRDPLAPNAEVNTGADLDEWLRLGLVRNFKQQSQAWPPRLAAANGEERALRGYLRANCGNCHSATSNLDDVGMFLDAPTTEQLGDARIVERVTSRDPRRQMPPLGTRLVDLQAVALLEKWRAANVAPDSQQ